MAKGLIICKDCGEEREHYALGLCRSCYAHRYYQENRDRELLRARQYRENNREECLEANRRWRRENPEKVRGYYERYRKEHLEEIRVRNAAYQREYRKRNPEKVRVTLHNWYLRNFERVLATNARRRAREISLPNTLTNEQTQQKLSIGCCFYCEKEIEVGIDHFVPLIRGGGTTLANSVAACKYCNSSKREKLPEEILVQLPLCLNYLSS